MFEKFQVPENKNSNEFLGVREKTDIYLNKFKFVEKEDIIEMNPEKIKDEVPVFVSPGWGVVPKSQKETLDVLVDEGRKIITSAFKRENFIKEKDNNLPIAELQKSLAIIEILKKTGNEKVDAVGHSEGGLNLAIAAMIYPEKFRDIVFVSPAGIVGKESYLSLIKRFILDEGLEEMKSTRQNNQNSFYEYFKNLLKYSLENISLSKDEIREMSQIDILEITKALKERGVGVSIICGVNDKVFPIERVIDRVNKDNLDAFLSTKGNHGSFIFNKEHAVLAENILCNMNNKY